MGGSQGPNLECGEECLVSGRRTLNGYGATVLRDGKDFGAWCWWWTSRWAVAAKMLKDGPKGSGKKKRVMAAKPSTREGRQQMYVGEL